MKKKETEESYERKNWREGRKERNGKNEIEERNGRKNWREGLEERKGKNEMRGKKKERTEKELGERNQKVQRSKETKGKKR